MEHHPDVDTFLACTPRWRDEAAALRAIFLGAGLTEAIKWGKPTFLHGDRNIAILQPMNDFLALMFFKGALLDDPDGLLQEQGEHTRAARRLCFTSVAQVARMDGIVREFARQAVDVEDRGLELPPAPELELVPELRARLDREPALRAAFHELTPGRQREYHLFVSGAKQSATRAARIEKHVARILAGKGLRDR